MPHDLVGNSLTVGDIVLVPARVKSIYPGDEYCNVTLETTQAMFPGTSKSGMTLNASQVILHTAIPSCDALEQISSDA